MRVSLGDFTYKPYYHGFKHLQKACNVTQAASPVFCSEEDPEITTLCGRVKQLGLTLLLWIPIINIAIHFALHYFSPSEIWKKEQLEPLLNKFVQDLLIAKKDSQDPYQKFLDGMKKLDPIADDVKTFNGVKWTIKNLNLDEKSPLTPPLKALAVYRLWNQHVVESFSPKIRLKDNWTLAPTWGDGNCLLWSCIISEKIRTSKTRKKTIKEYADFQAKEDAHPKFAELEKEMMAYRKQMAELFKKRIVKEKNENLRVNFLNYVTSESDLRNAVLKNDINEDAVWKNVNKAIPQIMVNRYVDYLSQSKNWNADFEARLLADILKRTIVILTGKDEKDIKKLPVSTIAGEQYLDSNKPIFVRFVNNNHYDCLVS